MSSSLIDIAAVPESRLSAELAAELPTGVAPAPWRARANVLFWWSKPDERAKAALRDVIPDALGAGWTPRLIVGALINYKSTPVGGYSEVIGLVSLGRGAKVINHVPFIAVDSRDSIVGGRANWALPKTLAAFTGHPASGVEMTASIGDCVVTATPTAFGPPIPIAMPPTSPVVQVGPGGRLWSAKARGRGVIRLAHVEASVADASFGDWFPAGRRLGVVGSVAAAIPAATVR